MDSQRILPFELSENWPTVKLANISQFIVVILALVVVYIIVSFIKKQRREGKTEDLANKEFGNMAIELNLTQEEKKVIDRMAKRVNKSAINILESPYLFELAVHKFLEFKSTEKNSYNDIVSSIRIKCGFDNSLNGKQIFSSRSIIAGQKVLVSLFVDKKEHRISSIVSKIDEQIVAVLPISGDYPKTENLENITLVVHQNGDGEYTFTLPVNSFTNKGELMLAHSMSFTRKQVREFIRVAANVKVKFRFSRAERAPDRLSGGARFEGDLKDISGGGTSLESDASYDSGDRVVMSFTFMGEQFYGIKGEVLRIRNHLVNGKNVYTHQIRFVEIDTSTQERIVKLTFAKNREDVQWQKSTLR